MYEIYEALSVIQILTICYLVGVGTGFCLAILIGAA